LVAGGSIGNPGGNRQHFSQELPAALVVSEIETGGRLIEQVLQIRPGSAQSFTILLRPLFPDERIAIFAPVHYHDSHVEALSQKEFAGSGGRTLARGVRVEAEDDLGCEAPQ